jgi:hypothetical protein
MRGFKQAPGSSEDGPHSQEPWVSGYDRLVRARWASGQSLPPHPALSLGEREKNQAVHGSNAHFSNVEAPHEPSKGI